MADDIPPYVPFPVFVQDNPVENYSSRVYPIYETDDTLPGGGGGQVKPVFDLTVSDAVVYRPDSHDLMVSDAELTAVPFTYVLTLVPDPVDFGTAIFGGE